jgi:hypothetical protein
MHINNRVFDSSFNIKLGRYTTMTGAMAVSLRDDPEVLKLVDVLGEPGSETQSKQYAALLDYFETLTNQYNAMMTELAAVKERLGDITDKKNPITVMVEHLSGVISGIGAKLMAIKDSIVEFTKNTLESARDKGLSAVGAVAGALHIHDGLEAISKGLGKCAEKVGNIEQFHLDRVESNLLTEIEIPANLDSLPKKELSVVYGQLLCMGKKDGLSSTEHKIVQDLIEAVEEKLPERNPFEPAHGHESEMEQGEEM